MSVRILAAGDHFMLPRIIVEAIEKELAQASVRERVEYREYQSPWPGIPFGRVGEVEEGSGDEDELIEVFRGVNISVHNHTALTRKIIESSTDLKMAVIARGGPTNANIEAATERGVIICNAPGRNAAATAEHTVSLIFSVMRRIPELHAALRKGEWRGDYYEYDKCGLELDGATIGIIGYGMIGRRVAAILRACGCRILVYDPFVSADKLLGAVELVSLEELLKQSQVITIHARLTDNNNGMIGRQQIAMMPSNSVIVNCARGPLVDYDAVCDALDDGHLWGAGFDVFPDEGAPASRLRSTPNVVMTPHIAGASKQTAHKAAGIAASEIRRFLTGEPLLNCRNPEVLLKGKGNFATVCTSE